MTSFDALEAIQSDPAAAVLTVKTTSDVEGRTVRLFIHLLSQKPTPALAPRLSSARHRGSLRSPAPRRRRVDC